MKRHYYTASGCKLLAASAIVMGAFLVNVQAAAPFPDIPVLGPTDQFPTNFVPFDASALVTTAVPNSGAPQIAEWTRQNNSGDTMALTGENLEADFAHFIFSDATTTAAGMIQRLDGRQCALTLPDTLAADEFYLMWPMNANGVGYPVGINQTELWWSNDYVATGSVFRVFGQNLELDGTNYLYIAELDEWLSTTNCNPYMAQYTLPAKVTAGNYTIYAHNGHGMKYGWSEPLDITVWNGYQFSGNSGTWYNAVSNGLVADGVTDNRDALNSLWQSIKNDAWPTIYFPAGDYLIGNTSGVEISGGASTGVRFVGDGTNSIITCRTVGYYTESIKVAKEKSVFKNIAFRRADTGLIGVFSKAINLYRVDNLRFDGVTFTEVGVSKSEDRPMLVIDLANHVTFTNCSLYLSRHIDASGTDLVYDSCDFRGLNDCGGYLNCSVSELALINSTSDHYDNSDGTSGEGWTKGRWLTSGAIHQSVNWYIGGNINTNAQPRYSPAYPVISSYASQIDPPTEYNSTHYQQNIHFDGLSAISDSIEIARLDNHCVEHSVPMVWAYTVVNFDKDDGYCTIVYEKIFYDDAWGRALFSSSTNQTLDLIDFNDWNAGEQFMKEGGESLYRGLVLSGTSNTTTFADISSYQAALDKPGLVAVIVNGKGLGQARTVEDLTNETITLSRNWRVEPDVTSIITIGQYATQWVLYDNYLHSDLSDFAGDISASSALQFAAGGGGQYVVMDGNTVVGAEFGVNFAVAASDVYSVSTNTVSPWYFGIIANNSFQGVRSGFREEAQKDENSGANPVVYDDPLLMCSVVRNNIFDGTVDYVFVTENNIDAGELMVWDGNVVTNTLGELDNSNYRHDNDIWIGNTFYGSGNGLELFGNPVALQGNTFIGFTSDYVGTLSAVLELPQRTGYTNANEQTFEIYNSGTTNGDFIANGQTNDIAAESSASFAYTATSATNFTVTGGGDSFEFYVFASENPLGGVSVSIGGKSWDLKPWRGKPLRAELKDMTLDSVLKLWESSELENVEYLNVFGYELTLDHQYRFRIEQYDGTKWVRVVGDTWTEKLDH